MAGLRLGANNETRSFDNTNPPPAPSRGEYCEFGVLSHFLSFEFLQELERINCKISLGLLEPQEIGLIGLLVLINYL